MKQLLCCRSMLTNDQLQQVLRQHPLLESLKLSCCPRVTDKALEPLPSDSMRELRLVCCDGIEGSSLSLQHKLEILEFSSCNCVTERSIQVRLDTLNDFSKPLCYTYFRWTCSTDDSVVMLLEVAGFLTLFAQSSHTLRLFISYADLRKALRGGAQKMRCLELQGTHVDIPVSLSLRLEDNASVCN